MSPQEAAEFGARIHVWTAMMGYARGDSDEQAEAALDAYRDAVAARVRWGQQADAEGYDIPGGAR